MTASDFDPFAGYGSNRDECGPQSKSLPPLNTSSFWFHVERIREPLEQHSALERAPELALMRVVPAPTHGRRNSALAPKFELPEYRPKDYPLEKILAYRNRFWVDAMQLARLCRKGGKAEVAPRISVTWMPGPRYDRQTGLALPSRFDVFGGRLEGKPTARSGDAIDALGAREWSVLSLQLEDVMGELKRFIDGYRVFLDSLAPGS